MTQALVEVERAVALDPNEAGSYALLAEVLSRVGRSEEALEAAEKAQRLKPTMVDVHLHFIGTAYYLAGRTEERCCPPEAISYPLPQYSGCPPDPGCGLQRVRQDAEARTEAAEVLRINPKFSLEVHKERVPIKDLATLERHIAALRKAGLK